MKNKEIEEFDKKQLEELLKRLKDINNFTGFKDGAFKYYLGKYEADLLLSYIEQLEKDNKDLDRENQILFESNLKLENNRDKAIEYFKFENPEIFKNPKYTNHLWTIDGLTIKRFIDILKGDSDYE